MKQITAILLAAGFASRFGSNKLLFPVEGEGMFSQTLRKVMKAGVFSEILVVTQYQEVQTLANEQGGCRVIWNPHPEEGIASSIRLGVAASKHSHALMFFVCDQPYLTTDTIRSLTEAYQDGILCPVWEDQRGNPVIFAPEFRKELLDLSGDVGGRVLLRKYPEKVKVFPIKNSQELWDFDKINEE